MKYVLLILLIVRLSPANAAAEPNVIARGDGEVVVDFHFLIPGSREPELLHWLEFGVDALLSVYGRLPREQLRVNVRPIGVFTDDSIPWAQVNRGDPDTVSFYIDALASADSLKSNWTTYHELSHLLIPYQGWGDMWFSEGLASYYQNLLQARAAIFDEREMWQRLYDGFERGRKNYRPDLTLAQLSPFMRENRSFMRVY